MNSLNSLSTHGHATISSANFGFITTTDSCTTSLKASSSITLGSHTFNAEQLGQLLAHLSSQHPEAFL